MRLKKTAMTYRLFIRRNAQKQLAKIPANDYKAVKKVIFNLANNPRPKGAVRLKGREGWRVRQGVYRIVYNIEDDRLVITVINFGHRKDVYR